MRALGASRTSVVPGGALAGGWARNPLWKTARAVPSLDLRFAENKTLGDAYGGGSPVTFTRASTATFVGSDGVIQTAATNAPRFTHDPTTGESLGLLVEEARTNLLLNSATLSTQSVTVAAAANTLSFYGTGTVTLTGVSTAGPLVGTGADNRVSLTFTPTVGVLILTVSGSVTNAQLEAGAFPTSYIPTTSATVTRAADVASITGSNFSSWYNQTEGTVFANATAAVAASILPCYASIDNGTTSERLQLRRVTSGTSPSYRVVAGGQSIDSATKTIGSPTGFNSHVLGYASSNYEGACNGTLEGLTSIANRPTVTQLQIGNGVGSAAINGTIKRLTYWPTRLANTTLQQITQP